MNHYIIEVIFDENHELVDVNLRGPGSFGLSYDVHEAGEPDLRNILWNVAADIMCEERA